MRSWLYGTVIKKNVESFWFTVAKRTQTALPMSLNHSIGALSWERDWIRVQCTRTTVKERGYITNHNAYSLYGKVQYRKERICSMVTVRLRLDRDEWSVEWMKEWVDRRSTQQRWTRRVKLSLHYVLLSCVSYCMMVTRSWDVHRSSAGGFDTIRSRVRILILVLVEVNFVVFRGDDDRLRGSLQRHVEALRVLCTTLERIHKALAGWALHRPHFRFNNVRLVF